MKLARLKEFFDNPKEYLPEIISVLLFIAIVIVWLCVPQEILLNWVGEIGFWGPFIYILVHIIGDIVFPISTGTWFIGGYYVFGDKIFLYESFVYLFTTIFNFAIARKYGIYVIKQIVGKRWSIKIENLFKEFDSRILIILRFFTFSFNDYTAYAYGLTGIKFWTYFVVSILSGLFWIVLWRFFIIQTIGNFLIFYIWFIISSVPFYIITWLYLRSKKRRSL